MLLELGNLMKAVEMSREADTGQLLSEPVLATCLGTDWRSVFGRYLDQAACNLNQPLAPLIDQLQKRTLQSLRRVHVQVARTAKEAQRNYTFVSFASKRIMNLARCGSSQQLLIDRLR
jgi:hypothetical protein